MKHYLTASENGLLLCRESSNYDNPLNCPEAFDEHYDIHCGEWCPFFDINKPLPLSDKSIRVTLLCRPNIRHFMIDVIVSEESEDEEV